MQVMMVIMGLPCMGNILKFINYFLGPLSPFIIGSFIVSIIGLTYLTISYGISYPIIVIPIVSLLVMFNIWAFIFAGTFVYYMITDNVIQKEWNKFKELKGIK